MERCPKWVREASEAGSKGEQTLSRGTEQEETGGLREDPQASGDEPVPPPGAASASETAELLKTARDPPSEQAGDDQPAAPLHTSHPPKPSPPARPKQAEAPAKGPEEKEKGPAAAKEVPEFQDDPSDVDYMPSQ